MPLGLKLSIVACTLAACAVVLSVTGHAISLLFSTVSIVVSIVSLATVTHRRKR